MDRDNVVTLVAAADALQECAESLELTLSERERLYDLLVAYGRARFDVVDLTMESDLRSIRSRELDNE